MKSVYLKRPIPISKQLDYLESKGLVYSDRRNASHLLSLIGFYRFSGYAYPFRDKKDQSRFTPGTSFETIFSLYEFDRSLKLILFSALGRIEIAFRSLIIDKFSAGTGTTTWYADKQFFTSGHEHTEFIDNLEYNLKVSREEIIQYFRKNYSDRFPPAWIALQVTSFGTLVKLFRNFNRKDLQSDVARYFGCDRLGRFISWMNTMVYLRNICSHHARLWNRNIMKRPEAYNFGIKSKRWTQEETAKLYYSICVVGNLLKKIVPDNSLKKDLAELLNSNSYADTTKSVFLGFPVSWQNEFAW